MESCKLRYFNSFEFFDHTGSLRKERFIELLEIALAGANLHSIERAWLVLPDGN